MKESNSPRISAVVFDAVGTLIYPMPSVAQAYRESIRRHCDRSISGDIVDATIRNALKQRSNSASLQTSEAAEHEFWADLVHQLCPDSEGFEACFAELFEHFGRAENWRAFSDSAAAVAQLRASGIRMAVASNFDLRLHGVCDGLEAISDIEVRVISSVVGWRKPSKQFFAAVVEQLDCPAGEILMVGDDLVNDVRGAREAGLNAAWIDRSEASRTSVDSAVLHIRSLLELSEHINPAVDSVAADQGTS